MKTLENHIPTIVIAMVSGFIGYGVNIASSYASYRASEERIISRLERLEEFAQESTADRQQLHKEAQEANRLINSKLEVLLLKVAALEAQSQNSQMRSK